MDGHFVPNLVLGECSKRKEGLSFDLGLNVSSGAPPLSSVHKAVPGIFMDVRQRI